MLKLSQDVGSKISSNHEEVFVRHYDSLLEGALRITQGDRIAAEDLVQEAFVQFTFTRPELSSIKYLEAYLYGMLRNLHLMDLRRATHRRSEPLALIDFDSIEVGLRTRDLSQVIQTKNELALICQYSCQRKKTSKAGSVLILRFFHGYYPSEISQVIRSSRPVVSELLQIGRKEARRFSEDPRSLSFLGNASDVHDFSLETGLSYSEILNGLRRAIFRSRTGSCFSKAELEEIYRVDRPAPLDIDVLAHLVSCEACIDSVNEILNLPLLADRNPSDMLSPNKPEKGGGSGPDGPDDPSGGAAHLENIRKKCRRHARSVFEHEPSELCVSVNGDRQFWQKIASPICEQTFSLEPSDKIELLEISSEQGIRLLMMQVEQTAAQSAEVALSEGRILRVSLDQSASRPLLRVRYEDPSHLSDIEVTATSQAAEDNDASSQRDNIVLLDRLRKAMGSIFGSLTVPKIAFTMALLGLIGAFLLTKSFRSGESGKVPLADDLLQRSISVEQAFLTRTDTVLHRSIKVDRTELINNLKPAQISTHKIEIWRSAEKGITARRLFNQHDRLVAGLWQRRDGIQTLYQHGRAPELKLASRSQLISPTSFWQEEPTASEFLRIVGSERRTELNVEELTSTYLITYEPKPIGSAQVVKASVALTKADLHVTEMTVVVKEGIAAVNSPARLVEYHFTESSFERHSPSMVPSSTFEPEKELLNNESNRVSKANLVSSVVPAPETTTRPVATADLEVELLQLLHDANADLGEQITVTRSRDGLLRVAGVVETEQRRSELLSTLKPVIDTQVVHVELKAVADALKGQTVSRKARPSESQEASSSEAVRMPVENDLRKYFSHEGDRADELSQKFAIRIVTSSRKSMIHVYALKRLLRQFSPEELRELGVDAKVKWLGLVQAHASAFKVQVDLMRSELQPVFFPEQSLSVSSYESTGDAATTVATAEQLVNLATTNDMIIRYSLTTSPNSSSRQTIKNREFWESLEQTRRLAAVIVGARQ
jgi:RNA polymerase sigma factor (sigma-70 family)